MNNTGTIQTSKSADLVTFKILIEGEELSKQYEVKNITVSKEVNKIPTAQIVLIDGDASERDFKLSNEELLIPGKEIEITAGYHSDEETIFKGIVIKHNLRIRASSAQLIVECKDEAVKMTVGRKSKYFYESTDSDIFEEIIGKYSLSKDVETTNYNHAELVQYNASDWDFVVSRAQANGKLCFVDDGTITIAKPNVSQSEIETVTFGGSLLDFDAEIDARHQVKKVAAYSWNHADQEVIEIEGKDPNVSLNGNLSVSDLNKTIGLESMELRHGGVVTDTELQDWADAKWLFQQLAKVRGRVKFQGIPSVKPNTILKLEGVGDRFNGNVYVTGVQHVISEGNWVANAQFGLSTEWFSETFEISAKPASGLLPAIQGLQVGIVSQLEEDPDGEDRILVQIPIVNNEEEGIWCRVASPDAGENRGIFFRPEIGDEVIVGFINEDPNDAIVLGMLHSSAKPSPITATDDNHEKGIVTRSEMKVLFNDDKKIITIETPAGKIISLDEDEGAITIEDDNSNVITINGDGISMESAGDISLKASGDVNIEGTNVSIAANAEFKAEGSAGAEVSTSAIAVLKGSLVQIN
ncbi:type IV secretion protein Rhs [Tenacibaculum discolor]|uniref:Type IV secretion protein Rhs n=1 Tax=Tenacibaculum discolor TaxID=361581 RepID=A0A2G1BTN4_9FLAO|nr:type VI secretion system tip protein VgrG [Tenacibaculum discolor]MDP2541582.1 type VI secretion system tip protein VgrG [Tenacibaculum discolor]PHN97407.1 type IV secretion protein Rhs [Tenacibaculum discolor]PHO00058.1 type IV secretion protein Rhs [Rhodobacteraceae bacterium 4F10]